MKLINLQHIRVKFIRDRSNENKELIVDFRKHNVLPELIIINGHTVKRVCINKYMRVLLQCRVWHGVNLMSGYKSRHSKSIANK